MANKATGVTANINPAPATDNFTSVMVNQYTMHIGVVQISIYRARGSVMQQHSFDVLSGS